jgi:putative transposase
MMDDFDSLSHSRWECKYHVVFIPKCRRKVLYAQLRGHLGEVFRRLAQQKESRVEEGHLWRIMFICCCRYRQSMRCHRWSAT